MNEYAIGTKLSFTSVVKPISLRSYQGMPTLITEDFGGESLDRYVGEPMEIGRFLRFAVQIAAATAEIHENDFIHKDLKTENIVVHPSTNEVKIADFGIASQLVGQRLSTGNSLIEGSLPYMSPEQTGRISRTVDQRSDLYSLGVTFYEMLTGKLPFQANDPLEWVHCHVARQAIPPAELITSVPSVLSACVMKLLAKEPDDRYQSARGLQHDLEKCLTGWTANGQVAPFPLGEHDAFGRLRIPQKLYGREQELAALLSAFGRVIDSGAPELVLVSGYSGIGKSSLVQELEQPIVRERGVFAFGKVDQYKRDIPYAMFVQAFTELVLEILTGGEAQISDWRERLNTALGINGQLIVDVIPAVELIIGHQPVVPILAPAEAQNRFRIVFRHFISVFAQREHPLVLFLDDLQWADMASLDLLEDLLTRPEARHLLIVGAYRDSEVSASHPLELAMARARQAGASIFGIKLGPLSNQHVCALIRDALHCRPQEAKPLADLVEEKTAGNPFFVIQFLNALDAERLIAFDSTSGAWRWDVEKIRTKAFTDNVAELMVDRLKRLPAPTQEALKQLASIGSSTDVETLGIVLDHSSSQVHEVLSEAVRLWLLVRRGSTYRFSHDRVQEAAYSLIPAASQPANHLRIGRLLLSHLSDAALLERVFEVVSQLNRGIHLMMEEAEKKRLCRLNFLAGKKAKAAIAYASAQTCLAIATSLLNPDAWQGNYEETLDLFLERSECEYLVGNFERADELFNFVLSQARSNPDRARVYRLRIALYMVSGHYDEALTVGLQALQLFGVILPTSEAEAPAALEAERRELQMQMRGRRIAELADLPVATDPGVRSIICLLVDSQPGAYIARPWMYPLLALKAIGFSMRYGNIEESCFAYSAYGTALVSLFEDIQSGFEFSEMSLRLNQKFNDPKLKGRVTFCHGAFINPWRRHLSTNAPFLERAFRASLEIGDLVYASFHGLVATWHTIEKGDHLDEVLKVSQQHVAFAQQTRNEIAYRTLRIDQQFVAALKGTTREPACLDDGSFQEAECLATLANAGFGYGITLCQIAKEILSFTYGRYAEALAASTQAAGNLALVMALPVEATHHFYHALTLAAVYPQASAAEQVEYRKTLAEKLRKLKLWAENCPANYLNVYALVSGEVARIEGRDLEAMRLYDQAIQSASENGFVQNEALAQELAAKFYLDRGFGRIADSYLREARASYARWGAEGKVKQLERRHPQLEERRPLAPTATFAVRAEQMDILSIVKASQAISGEILMDSLLRKLVEVVIEQAGAQKGYVILCRQGQLAIEAEALLDEHGGVAIKLLRSLPVATSSLLPTSLVNFVGRTKQRVLLEDALSTPKFSTDDYVVRTRPKSVLCLPILRRTELVGLLYLENNLITGAFSMEHLQLLEMLASQAAISLENARFIEQEHAARGAAEEAGKRAALFAEASALFSEPFDYKIVLARLAELVVRSVADWCVVDLLEDEEIHRLARAHVDPEKEAMLTDLEQRYPVEWTSPAPSVEAIKMGRSLLFPEISEEILQRYTDDEQQRQIIKILGAHTGIVVPLRARGQVLGAIAVAAGSPRRFSTADLDLVEELASRASIAIDNARLYRQTLEALRLRDEFLTVAAHELRTPITSLALTLDSMKRSAEPEGSPSIRKGTELAFRQGQRLKRLVSELLDVTRLDLEQLQIFPEQVELGTLVREVADRFTPELTSAQCSISVRAEAPVIGWWDRSQIEQVLTNLLSNAIKFGRGEQIEIGVSQEAYDIAQFVVRDHGIGIDPTALSRLFQRFGRAVSERHYGGLGLGLYICRRIVEAHDGAIRVVSQLGEGATFTVQLPCKRPAATDRVHSHRDTLSRS